jgi:O-antigen/teichoic acid export membrane protein
LGLARNSVGTFISNAVVYLMHFPIGILVARFLGPEGKGLLYLLTLSVIMCAALGNFGLGSAAIYFIGKERSRLPAVVGNLLATTGIVGVIVNGAGWIFLYYIRPDIYVQLPVWVWMSVALLVPLHLLQTLLMQALSALLRIKEINRLTMAAAFIELCFLLAFLVLLDGGIGGAFLAHALAETSLAVSSFLMLVRYGGRPTWPDATLFVDSIRYGVKSYLSNLMRILNLRLDTFLVATLTVSGVHATGIYTVATRLVQLVLFVPMSIRLSLFPMVASSNTSDANRLTLASCRHTLLLTLVLALGLGTIGPFAIRLLYGEAFAGAVLPLLILLPGVVLLSQARIFYGDLSGRGKPGATTISTLLSLIVTLTLDFLLIPRYGITGAALASTCAYTTEFIVAGSLFIRHSGLRWREMFIFQRADLYYYLSLLPKLAK